MSNIDLIMSSMFGMTFPSFRALLVVIRVRTRVQVLREERLALLAKGSQAVPIQAIFRGFVTRKTDQLVRVSLPRVPGAANICRIQFSNIDKPSWEFVEGSLAVQRLGTHDRPLAAVVVVQCYGIAAHDDSSTRRSSSYRLCVGFIA